MCFLTEKSHQFCNKINSLFRKNPDSNSLLNHQKRCTFCHGHGRARNKQCTSCHGRGRKRSEVICSVFFSLLYLIYSLLRIELWETVKRSSRLQVFKLPRRRLQNLLRLSRCSEAAALHPAHSHLVGLMGCLSWSACCCVFSYFVLFLAAGRTTSVISSRTASRTSRTRSLRKFQGILSSSTRTCW